MKTLKSIILGLAAVVTFSAANAKAINPSREKKSVNDVVNVYVNAMTLGQIESLSAVLDDNFKSTTVRGDAKITNTKTELLDFLKTTKNVKQDCKSTVTINESTTPDQTVVKVDMQYKDFTRTNYVTLTNTEDGWKIISVYSVFK